MDWSYTFFPEKSWMKSTPLVPMLRVGDIEQTIAFYRDVLGFACTNQMKG